MLEQEYTDFIRQTKLDELHPGEDFRFTLPGQYDKVLQHISVHRWFMGEKLNRPVTDEHVAPSRTGVEGMARNGEDVASLVECRPRGDEASGFRRGLHHDHRLREAGDDPVAQGEVRPVGDHAQGGVLSCVPVSLRLAQSPPDSFKITMRHYNTLWLAGILVVSADAQVIVQSPKGQVQTTVASEGGRLTWSVTFNGQQVLAPGVQ